MARRGGRRQIFTVVYGLALPSPRAVSRGRNRELR